MALANPVKMSSDVVQHIVHVAQVPSPWVDVIDEGGMDGADNSGNDILIPDTQVTASDHHIGKCGKRGTAILLRMVYDDAVTSVTADAVVQVFGRYDSDDPWQRLVNKNDEIDITMTVTVATDLEDGTVAYTHVDQSEHWVDLNGCDEFLVGVKTAWNGADGNDAAAKLQAKVI